MTLCLVLKKNCESENTNDKDWKPISCYTAHLNEKNLSTNSSWGFEHVLDTMNYYWLCPDDWFVHSTLPTRWRCNQFSKKWPKSKSDTTFTNKKTSVTPTFCKRNFSRMNRFGLMIFFSFATFIESQRFGSKGYFN